MDAPVMSEVLSWLYALNDHKSRAAYSVHVDDLTVWAEGEIAGTIRIDGDTYVFEPTSKGAST